MDDEVKTHIHSVLDEAGLQLAPRNKPERHRKQSGVDVILGERLDDAGVYLAAAFARGEQGFESLRRGETTFESGGNEVCVAVDVVPDCEDGNASVSNAKQVGYLWSGQDIIDLQRTRCSITRITGRVVIGTYLYSIMWYFLQR